MGINLSNPETAVLHAGWRADSITGAVAVPIHQTTSYQFASTDHAAELFARKVIGLTYSRVINPTHIVLEQRVAALDGGFAGLAVGSGAAARLIAILNLCRRGDNIVAAADISPAARDVLSVTLPRFGITTRFVDPHNPHNFVQATDKQTRLWFGEALSIPTLTVFPVAAVAAAAEQAGVPLVLDNTLLPVLNRPLHNGAHIVVYDAGPVLSGHGTVNGGVIVDSNRFDWQKHAERFPNMIEPDRSYHGKVWAQEEGDPYIIRARAVVLRDFGPAAAPLNVFQILQGLETLPLRIRAQDKTAAALAAALTAHRAVAEVIRPQQGGFVALRLKHGDVGALAAALHLFNPAATLGSIFSAVAQTDCQTLLLSAGLEHPDDLRDDLLRALDLL